MTNRIHKEGKAQWVYACEICAESATMPDQFRAVEFERAHEGTMAHAGAVMGGAIQSIFDTFAAALRPAVEAMASIADMLAPPKNTPHDPRLLRDRRKWGGK